MRRCDVRTLATIALILALALPAAAVENGDVRYCGRTLFSVHTGSIGRLDTTSDESLIFASPDTKLSIPYTSISSYEYTQDVTRHLGVLPAIGVGLLKMRRHSHYFRILYTDSHGPQVAIFEVSKQTPRVLSAVLQAHAAQVRSKRCSSGN